MIIRKATSSDLVGVAQVHVDSWQTSYRGLIPDRVLDDLSYSIKEKMWQDYLLHGGINYLHVAEDEGKVVGFVAFGENRRKNKKYQGEISALYILEGYQRQGLGSRLVKSAVQQLKEDGINSMIIWVLAENPAVEFYRSLGGEQVEEKILVIGGTDLDEIAFGWNQLDNF